MDQCAFFQNLISLATEVGDVNTAQMYSKEFMTIEGTTDEGSEFRVVLSVKEKVGEKNGD